MNILIKLMSIVSLVIAPTLATIHGKTESKEAVKKEVIKEKNAAKPVAVHTLNGTDIAAVKINFASSKKVYFSSRINFV